MLNFVDEPYRQAFETLHQQAFSGQHGSLEFTVTGKHGHKRWLDTHAAPLKKEEGRVTSVLSVTRDISLLKQQQLELKHMAHFDALTRLPNRTLLSERMSRAVVLARRHQTEFAVCYLDLDGFKPINDELGHDAGDQVLIEIGNRLTGALREVDTVSRLGGDEFVLLMNDLTHDEDWQSVLSRVLMEVTRPLQVQGQERSVSASIGVAFYPQDGEDPETLLRHADHAMYAAKRAGKNRYNLFSTEDGCVTETQNVD